MLHVILHEQLLKPQVLELLCELCELCVVFRCCQASSGLSSDYQPIHLWTPCGRFVIQHGGTSLCVR